MTMGKSGDRMTQKTKTSLSVGLKASFCFLERRLRKEKYQEYPVYREYGVVEAVWQVPGKNTFQAAT